MDEIKKITNLRTLPMYFNLMEKLTIDAENLTEDENTFLLTVAIILLKKYQKDNRLTQYAQLAYYIILKYSISSKDYAPLYDISINFGFYPIAWMIAKSGLIDLHNIQDALLPYLIEDGYGRDGIIETYSQKKVRNEILNDNSKDICYTAPTSFGKSTIIIEHICKNWGKKNKIAIILPTKSLLMQTYRSVARCGIDAKIITHDEMYAGQDKFIAVFTQERALRLLEKEDLSYDILYIDEAHNIFNRDTRAILLARLIKMNKKRNPSSETIYLSPFISDSDNLKLNSQQEIFNRSIRLNLKEPEYYEYKTSGKIRKYNRFLNEFFEIGYSPNMFSYIFEHASNKTFCYLFAPRKIEQFAAELASHKRLIDVGDSINMVIKNLEDYVHKDFYAIEYLKKGIIYLHGKMPEGIKEYLENKFSSIPEIQYIIANKVILEGINLPITSMFILNGKNLQGKELTNLIGRVNRLDQVFDNIDHIGRLMPQIYFVNSDNYNRKNGKLENKIVQLKSNVFADKIKNPLLNTFDGNSACKDDNEKRICEKIVEFDRIFFSDNESSIGKFKRKMIALGMNSIYDIDDQLCEELLKKIEKLKSNSNLHKIHFLDRLRNIFLRHLKGFIIDNEFMRLRNDQAISYYKHYFKMREKPFNEKISSELRYFHMRIAKEDSKLYIGKSYGEIPYNEMGKNVYIDLSTKTDKELANLAIIKQKLEDDFVNFKLRMFFDLMHDMEILNTDEYYDIIYGTTDRKKIYLVKTGLTINLISRLDKDDQLKNIFLDKNRNLTTNKEFEIYKSRVDDFYRFQLDRFL